MVYRTARVVIQRKPVLKIAQTKNKTQQNKILYQVKEARHFYEV